MMKTMKISFSRSCLSVPLIAADAGAAEIKQRTVKVSYGTAADHPFGLGVTKFSEIVDKKTDGKISVEALRPVSWGQRSRRSHRRRAACWKSR